MTEGDKKAIVVRMRNFVFNEVNSALAKAQKKKFWKERKKNMIEITKECPECGKKAILSKLSTVHLSDPPQYTRKWWCKCGYEAKFIIQEKDKEKTLEERWEEVNKVMYTA